MNTRRRLSSGQVWTAVLIVLAVVTILVIIRPKYGASVSTVATAAAAIFAFLAARESSITAREARTALALHERPYGNLVVRPAFGTADDHPGPKFGEACLGTLDVHNTSGLRVIEVEWTNQAHETQRSRVVESGKPFPMVGAITVGKVGNGEYHEYSVRAVRVQCEDTRTKTRWIARVPFRSTNPTDDDIDFHLDFEPT